jgi:hypothetical protein
MCARVGNQRSRGVVIARFRPFLMIPQISAQARGPIAVMTHMAGCGLS